MRTCVGVTHCMTFISTPAARQDGLYHMTCVDANKETSCLKQSQHFMLLCSVVFFLFYTEVVVTMSCFGSDGIENNILSRPREDAEAKVLCGLEGDELHGRPVDQIGCVTSNEDEVAVV